jgi:hypothetical protein
MARLRMTPSLIAVILVAIATGCGGETTGTGTHVDVSSDASAGGSRSGTGGAGTSNGGAGGSSLVACNDGTGNTDCCPPSAVEGDTCDASISKCSRRGCHAGYTSYLYCGGGTWSAGKGLFPCSVDAGPDGSVSHMSCSQLQTAWSSFRESHGQCATDTDCTTFLAIDPSSSPCDAPPGLNQALNKQFVGDAQPYADRYFSRACGGDQNTRPNARNGLWSDFGYDGLALTNPRCLSGSCTADSPGCNTGLLPDGGPIPQACGSFDEAQCPLDRCHPLPTCDGTSVCSEPFSGPPPSCGPIGYYGADVPCCSGLVKRCNRSLSDGSCVLDGGGTTDIPMCIACGDGTCDASWGETQCNCPEDCH